jgi:hypothetical protein
VEDLIREGRVLPVQRDAMIKLSMTDAEMFKALVPDKPIIALSGERGTSSQDSDILGGFDPSDSEALEKELARLTAGNPTIFKGGK